MTNKNTRTINCNWKSAADGPFWFICLISLIALFIDKSIIEKIYMTSGLFSAVFSVFLLNISFGQIIINGDTITFSEKFLFFANKIQTNAIASIGFVPRLFDKVYQEIYIKYNKNGIEKEERINILAHSKYDVGYILDHIKTSNPKVVLDEYCVNLLNTFKNTPEKLEKNWQDQFNIKWPLSRPLTNILSITTLIILSYLFYYFMTKAESLMLLKQIN